MPVLSSKCYRFRPTPDDTGLRLDLYLANQEQVFSRGFIRKVVDLGGVHVDGRRIRKCSYPVRGGETVEVYLDGRPLEAFVFTEDLVIYRDADLLAINKPAGIETQPTPARYCGTIYEALLQFLHNPFRPKDRPELGMVQRLDRETSGLMIFSIHKRAHGGLTLVFSGRAVGKFYLALVAGNLPDEIGEFRSLLGRNRASNLVRSVERGGKEAITRYRVLEKFSGASLVEVEILTGRSHQIRVHFSEAGHPLLGDVRYGGPSTWNSVEIPRQMLHSYRLSLPHPVRGDQLQLEAPLPCDFESMLACLRADNFTPADTKS
ncbi:MAG: pseudouridine synthase [Desulfuromonadaceae bacterium GWC2_58_13]|nr:MAG: pseudouridine synthase [Desulfuromonadaceae bacterium GWC2_58_13]